MMSRAFGWAAAAAMMAASTAAARAPDVVVSIAPLHSLVAGVMGGVGTPSLLVAAGASEHTYTMRPSAARAVDEARLVFWMGEGLERFLAKPVAALGGRDRSVELSDSADLLLLPYREGGAWEAHADGDGEDRAHAHSHAHGGSGQTPYDMHVWLSPENARRIVRHASVVLSEADPAHAGTYAVNADRLIADLDALEREIETTLAPVRDVPFVVFHDAYRYLEHDYGLNAVGSVMVSPEQAPGAKRLYEIRSKILDSGARCVFGEPQYDAALVATVVEGTPARAAVLDPLGFGLGEGPELYFTLMRNLATALRDCLAAGG